MERRLAAILAADVAGYSGLMEQDETATLDALKRLRVETVSPVVASHRGRIFKLMGDGIFVEFASIVDAVSCAVAIQSAIANSRSEAANGIRLTVRIGVHLGDVMVEDDDIYGDGVNIAARLEGLAEPGGIVISGQAFDTLERKLSFQITDLGQHKVKNIARPIHAYAVSAASMGAERPAGRATHTFGRGRAFKIIAAVLAAIVVGIAGWYVMPGQTGRTLDAPSAATSGVTSNRPTVIVLPLTMSGVDDDQSYFSSGITDDLITDLSKISKLTVIAQNSSFNYTGNTEDAVVIGDALKVSHVIKGSIRKAGETVRINVQIIDAGTGAHLWADRFDRQFSNIFSLQDEIVNKIVTALSVRLTSPEQARLRDRATGSVAAYDFYLQGLSAASAFTKAANIDAARLFRQAIEKDSGYSSAYAQLANLHEINVRAGWTDNPRSDLAEAARLARKAISLDPDNPFCHWTLARVLKGNDEKTIERAIASLKRAIELQPSYADAYAYLTYLYTGTNRLAEAGEAIRKAMRLNPIYPFWYLHARGVMRFMQDDLQGAMADFKETVQRNPTIHFGRWWLAAAYAANGDVDEAEWEVEEMHALGISVNISYILETTPNAYPPFREKYAKALKAAGMPE